MKLTLAFGMQYDQAPLGGHAVVPLTASASLELGTDKAAVIDVVAEPDVYTEIEFNDKLGIFFLTYNLEGVPNPFIQDSEKVDLFV